MHEAREVEMLRLSGVPVLLLCVLVSFVFADGEKSIDDLKMLAGDWRSVGIATPASIHINDDGTYQGIAATGARTIGQITLTKGTASYQSSTSVGAVTLSEESGKDVLTFVPSTTGRPQKLERVR
jgi:hypothetical protein